MLKTCLLFLALAASAFAQTTVTGTVVDANGNPYANGTASAHNLPTSGQATVSVTPVPTNGSGFFSLTVPSSGSWVFTICAPPTSLGPTQNPTPTQVCFSSQPISISGTSQDITQVLNPSAAIIGPRFGGGSSAANIVLTPSAINFGILQTSTLSAAQSVTINSVGPIPLVISSVVLTGSHDFSSSNISICNGSIPAGASCVVSFQFSPTSIGAESATVTVNSNEPGPAPTIALSGTGTASASFAVNVTGAGTGNGAVASSEATPLINCSFQAGVPAGQCSNNYATGTSVTLTAAPSAGATFGGWTGVTGCGVALTCSFTVTAAVSVVATFNPPVPSFTVNILGTGAGSGTVTSADGSINCISTAGVISSGGNSGCSASFVQGTSVTLTESPSGTVPSGGSNFVSWSGVASCSTASTCTFNVTSNVTATANFAPVSAPISLVQTSTNCTVASTTIACTWASAQNAGDFNVCAGAWPDATTTVSSVVDTKTNTYTQVPTISPKTTTGLTQVAYYSQNIAAAAASANTTTMTLSAGIASISGSNLTAGGSTTTGTGFSTASVTPSANNLVLITILARLTTGNGPGAVSTVTGNSLTWVKVASLSYGATVGSGTNARLEVWRAMGASPTTGAISVTFGTSPTEFSWTVSQFSGTDQTGTNGSGAIGITASNGTSSPTASPMTVTMGTFGSASNATFGAAGENNTNVISAGTSMTRLGESHNGQVNLAIADEVSTSGGNVSPVTATYGGSATNWGIIGIELKVPANRRDMRCAEYSGVLTSGSPVDVSNFGTGTSASPALGAAITTTIGNDLLTGFTASNQSVLTADTAHNYTQEIKNTFGDDEEDRTQVPTGTYNFQPTLSASGNWIDFLVAWKPQNGSPPPTTFSVTVLGAGTGAGTVSGNAGTPTINCTISSGTTSGPCSSALSPGSSITLTATASAGSSFAGWSGITGCSVSATCTISSINASANITATFNGPSGGPFTLLNQEPVTQLPYPNSLFDKQLPNAGSGGPTAHLLANSDNIIQGMLFDEGRLTLATQMGGVTTAGINETNSPPIYYGQSTDPVYKVISCSPFPSDTLHNPNGTLWHIPAKASFNHTDSDHGFAVWDQTNDEVLSLFTSANDTNFADGVIAACPSSSHAGTATDPCPMSFSVFFGGGTSLGFCTQGKHGSLTDPAYNVANSAWSSPGFAPPVTVIRRAEVVSGHIKHAVNIYTNCENGSLVFPAIAGATTCGTASVRPPSGALVFLDYTNAQLADIQSKVNPVQFTYIEAMTLYGGYVSDTGGPGNIEGIMIKKQEGGQAYNSILGCSPTAGCAADPVLAYLDQTANDGSGAVTKTVGTTTTYRFFFWLNVPLEGGLAIDKHFHIADPCVAKTLAGVAGGC